MVLKTRGVPATLPAAASSAPPESEESPIVAAAAEVNAASDELNVSIRTVEEALQLLNLGVSTYVKVKGWRDQDGLFWSLELGYDRFQAAWRVAIRETNGHESFPDHEHVERWPFTQAPRKLRLSAVDKLPDLVEDLTKEAGRTARRLREKNLEVAAFARSFQKTVSKKAASK